jgi:UDP-glucose 4-epimerase
MRIAIAGATGLVGYSVAAALRAERHELVTIGRGAHCDVRADLARPAPIDVARLAGCAALVHAAGVIDEDFADPAAAQAKAGEGARMLLDAAERAGIAQLIYFSSAHVYGPLEGEIDETRPPAPRGAYAHAHFATEELFRESARRSGAALLVARPCAVFGPLASPATFARGSLIPFDFPRQALGACIELKSAGLQRRNFVCAQALGGLACDWLSAPPAGSTIANAPGPDELSVYDFALLCARVAMEETGRECRVDRPAAPAVAPAPFHYRTRRAALPGAMRLEEHVRGLVRSLMKKVFP